jgi:hypothetical protein
MAHQKHQRKLIQLFWSYRFCEPLGGAKGLPIWETDARNEHMADVNEQAGGMKGSVWASFAMQ